MLLTWHIFFRTILIIDRTAEIYEYSRLLWHNWQAGSASFTFSYKTGLCFISTLDLTVLTWQYHIMFRRAFQSCQLCLKICTACIDRLGWNPCGQHIPLATRFTRLARHRLSAVFPLKFWRAFVAIHAARQWYFRAVPALWAPSRQKSRLERALCRADDAASLH